MASGVFSSSTRNRSLLLHWLLALMAMVALLQHQPGATAAPFEPFESSPSNGMDDNFMMRRRRTLSSAAANLQERGLVVPNAGGPSSMEDLPVSGSGTAVRVYSLQRRSFPSAASYANRRSAHPCRWKLCGAYHNYNSLRRFF